MDTRKKVNFPYYNISISIGTSVIKFQRTYKKPCRYHATIEYNKPEQLNVNIKMVNEYNQIYTDVISVVYNLNFFVTLKYLFILPLLLMLLLFILTNPLSDGLPTHSDHYN